MKLALIHPSFQGVGGAEIVAVNQARYLRDHGFDVRIVTSAVDSSRWRDKLEGLRVDLLGEDDWVDRLRGRDAWFARRAVRLSAVLTDVEVAIAVNYPVSRVLAQAATSARKVWYCHEPNRKIHLQAANPTIADRVAAGTATETDAERSFLARQRAQRPLLPGIRSRFVTEGLRDAAHAGAFERICANSQFGVELVTRTYGPRAYRVLYPLMQLPDHRTSRSGLDRSALRILVHSRLEAPKNVDTIMRGFAQFIASGRHRGVLHVVGEGGSTQALKRLARALSIDHAVEFHGFLPADGLRQIYDACEVFALLPVDEPFGLVFPEAMVQGLIVVGPNHGGPFEILEQGKLGFTCDAFLPESVAAAFERIVTSTDREIDAMRVEADGSCRTRFSWETLGAQVISAFGLG